MATEVMSESAGVVLGVRATGKLSDEDYKDVWIPRINEVLEQHGEIRFLLYMDDGFDGFEPGAMWDDAKFGFSHLGDAVKGKFKKIAMVGGSKWERRFAEIFGHLIPGEIEGFESSGLERAWAWVKS